MAIQLVSEVGQVSDLPSEGGSKTRPTFDPAAHARGDKKDKRHTGFTPWTAAAAFEML